MIDTDVPSMIDIEDRSHAPHLTALCAYSGELLSSFCREMDEEFSALPKIEYSGDRVLPGWNIKFRKAGRTLCTVYPRIGHFPMLLVVGRKEKARVETLLPILSDAFSEIYCTTQEGMGQRWLLLDLTGRTPLYDDALRIIRIRRESR